MNLQYFPMDRQLCHIEIESCKYFLLQLKIKEKKKNIFRSPNPLQFSFDKMY